MRIRTTLAGALALAVPLLASPLAQASQLAPPIVAPPGYTELRIAPPPSGTVYVYEGRRLLGRFDRSGSILVPTGRDYRVVATRGDTQLWSGDVSAAGAPLDLDWSQQQRFRQPFPPPRALETPTPPLGFPEGTGQVISTPALRSLLRAMDESSDDLDRLDALADATVRYAMTPAQASFVLGRFRSDAYRLAALERMRGHLVDRDDAMTLLERFRNPAARRFARDLLTE